MGVFLGGLVDGLHESERVALSLVGGDSHGLADPATVGLVVHEAAVDTHDGHQLLLLTHVVHQVVAPVGVVVLHGAGCFDAHDQQWLHPLYILLQSRVPEGGSIHPEVLAIHLVVGKVAPDGLPTVSLLSVYLGLEVRLALVVALREEGVHGLEDVVGVLQTLGVLVVYVGD